MKNGGPTRYQYSFQMRPEQNGHHHIQGLKQGGLSQGIGNIVPQSHEESPEVW